MKPILEIKNISKKFRIQHEKQAYLSLRDSVVSLLKRNNTSTEEFYALNDISFNVNPGESIGIIGKNGAGKSTLLKILSKISPPSSGKIISRGRIASLLEVGTGFHGELSGRENVFLNGSILGMKRSEIERNFDSIVDFSGVEKFLDTPLKHYSSGMQLRLAFAVAAFLENEILIIDEVLAVGDTEFQKKCIGKMEDVSKSGRTILFVSHSMTAIQSLCSKVVFIEKGTTTGPLSVEEGIHQYLFGTIYNKTGHETFEKKGNKPAHILEAKLLNNKNEIVNQLLTCEDFFLELKWENEGGVKITPSIELINYDGVKLFWSGDTIADWDGSKKKEKGIYTSKVKIPANFLKAGEYSFILGLYTQNPYIYHHLELNTLHCSLTDPMDNRCLARGEMATQFEKFLLLPALQWENQKI